jgi:hypothetical protein
MVGLLPCSPTIPNVRREVGATLRETRKRATRRLLEAVLKCVGVALLLVSCVLLVYLAAVLFARLSAGAFFPDSPDRMCQDCRHKWLED